MKFRKEYTCPLEFVHDILRGKWKTVIMWQINYRKNPSLSQLEKDIKGISQKVLMEQLKDLVDYELIYKEKSETYPLNVSYHISEDKGRKVIQALEILQELGTQYFEEYKYNKASKNKEKADSK